MRKKRGRKLKINVLTGVLFKGLIERENYHPSSGVFRLFTFEFTQHKLANADSCQLLFKAYKRIEVD